MPEDSRPQRPSGPSRRDERAGGARRPSGEARSQAGGPPRAKRKPGKASPARLAALGVLRAVRERGAFAQELIAARIDGSELSSEDRAFATRLALGVVSASGTLDEVIDRALDKPGDVQPDVRDALRLSAYEIVFLGKAPHAAVDQGVELVRSFAASAAGLANAVLRRIVALRASFPFGDPSCDIEALARLHAFPVWLARKLVVELGPQAAVDFMRASNEPAPVFVAVNALKASDREVCDAFQRWDLPLEPVLVEEAAVPGCYRLADARGLLHPEVKRLFSLGKILVSDAASQLVAAAVLPAAKPSSFLEVGAGRATKTILLQSGAKRSFGSQLSLTALDNHAFKTKLLLERAERYGASVKEAVTGDARELTEIFGARRFDEVFVDAPCSGLGTLRRHPEIRWRLRPGDVEGFARLQLAMLKAAAAVLAPGGILAYATCTVSREENRGLVEAFLASPEGAAFAPAPAAGRACVLTRLSPGSSDAHFAVRLARKA